MYKNIYLRKGKDAGVSRFHPWIFSGAIGRMPKDIEEGETVRVLDADGNFLAVGHFQIGSITIRILAFSDVEIDENFWTKRICTAYEMRRSIDLIRPNNNTFRLVHGEGDNLPGLIVDVYGCTAVMQAHSIGMHSNRINIAHSIIKVMNGDVKNVFYKSETTLPYKANLGQENGFIIGAPNSDVALENELKFHIDWLKGQKTGFFIDQRENRKLLAQYSKDKKVLNLFCYTGGFSVYAMSAGAKIVYSVDSSEKAIELTRKNMELNFPGDERHTAYAQDAFKFLDNIPETYDLVILDPPAFAKHKDALHNALKGYTRLNARAIARIASGGIIFTFSCSQAVSKEQFRLAVFTAAAQTKRKVRILHQLHQPADHPINIYHPEGEYLKGLVLYVE